LFDVTKQLRLRCLLKNKKNITIIHKIVWRKQNIWNNIYKYVLYPKQYVYILWLHPEKCRYKCRTYFLNCIKCVFESIRCSVQTVGLRTISGMPSYLENTILLKRYRTLFIKNKILSQTKATFHKNPSSKFSHIREIGRSKPITTLQNPKPRPLTWCERNNWSNHSKY